MTEEAYSGYSKKKFLACSKSWVQLLYCLPAESQGRIFGLIRWAGYL